MSDDDIRELAGRELLRPFRPFPEAFDFGWLFRLRIDGVEVTQGIQYYHASSHLTDPADRAPDNAVTLIVGKPAWVRVYVRSGFFGGAVAGVTATAEVSRRILGFLYGPGVPLVVRPPGTVVAHSSVPYATERGSLAYTLNFIIPAELMCGFLRLRVRITAPNGQTDETTLYLDVTLRQTLRLAGVMVGYNGPSSSVAGAPNLNLAAPTLAQLQATSAWTLLTFPVQSAATYRTAGTVIWNLPLTDAPSCAGCCTPNWVALNAAVQAQRVADGNRTDVLYYGLMAIGIPMGPVIGCNSGGVSTGANGNQVTMAHELGHACTLPHAPCGTPGDPNYPAYEPYDPAATPQASIGEYGLDISNGNIFSPSMFKDLMSYCGPRWISLYNYGRLTNNANLAPVRACVDHWWWRDVVLRDQFLLPEEWLPDPPPDPFHRQRLVALEPVISIIATMTSPDLVEVVSIVRLESGREVPNGKATDLSAELVEADGRVLAAAPVYSLRSYADQRSPCGCEEDSRIDVYPRLLQAFVPNVAPGAALRIRSGQVELWNRRASPGEPRIRKFSARLTRGNQLETRWSVEIAAKERAEYWLQWSADEGRTWRGLAANLHDERHTTDASSLPSGRVLLRLLASDGFHTAQSEGVAVRVPRRPPVVSILSPQEGETLLAGSAMRLWGTATRGDGDPLPGESARWLLDGRAVATGLDAFVDAPSAGKHRLTLMVEADGGRAEGTFRTVRVPGEGEESGGPEGQKRGRRRKR